MIREFLRTIDRGVFGYFYTQYPRLLEREIIGSCQTLLDVGCGGHSPIRLFSSKPEYSVGVDSFEPYLQQSHRAGIHTEYREMDVLKIGDHLKERSFDCVLASDLIEHLAKADGYMLLAAMEQIAAKKVVIFTPNGFLRQSALDGNPLQIHRSGWDFDEMRRRGYRVLGISGWKPMRGELAGVRWHPVFFWTRVSLLSQAIVANLPRYAYSLLCVKDVSRVE